MSSIFSDRISDVPRSFIREILKVTVDRDVISFAGGLPNRDLFPVEELKEATMKVFDLSGAESLQYSTSEGYIKLREYIADRYMEKQGIKVSPSNILITSGSQQGLDLLGKTFLNDGDDVIIEEPGYLGAIQAFSVYRARFNPVPVTEDGMDIEKLKTTLSHSSPKLLYMVPNYQNPAGISYPDWNRKALAQVLESENTLIIEDDPYGALRFSGERKQSFINYLPEKTIMLGSFSKTVVPSFRLGWIVAPTHIYEKLVIAKQASDLHTNYFCQRVVSQYLNDNNIDHHIEKIIKAYGTQCRKMLECCKKFFPSTVKNTKPEGGMFIWAELPEAMSSMDLFNLAVKDKVVFVPGNPFYVNRNQTNTLRLNFSCVDCDTIETGMMRLGKAIQELMEKKLC